MLSVCVYVCLCMCVSVRLYGCVVTSNIDPLCDETPSHQPLHHHSAGGGRKRKCVSACVNESTFVCMCVCVYVLVIY